MFKSKYLLIYCNYQIIKKKKRKKKVDCTLPCACTYVTLVWLLGIPASIYSS